MRTLVVVMAAVIGFFITCLVIYQSEKKVEFAPIAQEPASSPYPHFLYAQGIIESAYKNISIGAAFSDIITDIYVAVGDVVKKGAPLFKTDSRHLEAQLKEALADLSVAQTQFHNQEAQFSYYEHLVDKNAVSKQAYTNAQYQKEEALKKYVKAQATVDLYNVDLSRCLVTAPITGQVLQVNIRIGEYANQTSNKDPLILFGDPTYLHVRLDIDEEDAWRYKTGQPATAFVRGNKKINFPLEYVYGEPYIIPKRSLTGSDLERVDTRVLQVVYRFKRGDLPVYMGQLLDVYIQVPEAREAV